MDQQVQVPTEEKKVFDFAGGTYRDLQKTSKIRVTTSTTTFRYVRWYGYNCTPNLTSEPVQPFSREICRCLIDIQR